MTYAARLDCCCRRIAAAFVLSIPILLAACGPAHLEDPAAAANAGLIPIAAPDPAASATSRPRPRYRSVRGV